MKLFGIELNKKTFVRWKIYLDRARMYLSYINFIMIAFVFLNAIKDETIRSLLDENKWVVYPIVMLLFIGISLILGRLDTYWGMRREEMRNNSVENPVMREILSALSEIKENQQMLLSSNKDSNTK